ncbi:SGNH/GDSL hydrolase family protein [Alkalibacterium pelagium]|uniref:GDSL-like Lipase/Acylhydrolase n=1 Tax=Alkalibacterium pelagium TaxID=426702 RepID=A0A1H7G1U4_9LACT|nr:SGNH/GDSL hydrolase family protein [Alkalibacterium pelagium]GEN49937.1 hypothetical protein APE02nite_06020 [Alkalibacterium pelagium]SEK32078.1 hypothetical protein SAMN04488099_10231 [Alkalibacterium pelagium]
MKKSIISIPILLVACVLTIFFGQRYAANQREEMTEEQVETIQEEPVDGEDEPAEEPVEPSADLEDYEGRLDTLSHIDRIDYLSLVNEEVSVAFFGDIDLNSEWMNSVTEAIESAATNGADILDYTEAGLDSYELYIRQTSQPLVAENPDMILFGLPALPDKIRDIGLAETEQYMTSILNSFAALEVSELILLEPYPVVQEIDQLNSRSLDYRSYLNRMRELAQVRNLPVISLHSEFTERAQESGLESYYNPDDFSLTAEGEQLAADIVTDQLNEPVSLPDGE